ncbi:MAG: hypothetical protein ACJ79H_10025 [Myxococcales bacterium]
MSCGCGGSSPPYHPSDSYHWNGGGGGSGPTTDPLAPTGAETLSTDREPQAPVQPDRASSPSDPAAAAPSFPWGLALVVAIVLMLVRRAE